MIEGYGRMPPFLSALRLKKYNCAVKWEEIRAGESRR